MSEEHLELGESFAEGSDVTAAEQSRIAVISDSGGEISRRIEEAGGEAFEIPYPAALEEWGVALVREWLVDRLEMELSARQVDAVIFDADSASRAAAAVISAVRLRVPVVSLMPATDTFGAALAALGLTPLSGEDAVEISLDIIGDKKLTSKRLIDSLALANALRVGVALGAGPELLLHLSTIGKEADVVGFPRMSKVLIPETVAVTTTDSEWYRENGVRGILGYLAEDLNDTLTVCGSLRDFADEDAPSPEGDRIVHEFVRARSSGAEMLCRAPEGVEEISGKCLVFDSEADAVANIASRLEEFYEERRTELFEDEDSESEESDDEIEAPEEPDSDDVSSETESEYVEEDVIAVVRGCGPRGVPGVLVLEDLARTLKEHDLTSKVSVLTDGLAPENAPGLWASIFSPEAASGGVIGKLADGDFLKLDLEQGRILTSVDGKEISRRRSFRTNSQRGVGYARRYAKAAQPIMDGASFG